MQSRQCFYLCLSIVAVLHVLPCAAQVDFNESVFMGPNITGGYFGSSLATVEHGNIIRIFGGATGQKVNQTASSGRVYIYDYNRVTGTTTLLQFIDNPFPGSNSDSRFGEFIAAMGPNEILISCPNDDKFHSDSGVVYHYKFINGNFTLYDSIYTNSPIQYERFGWSVATLGQDSLIFASGSYSAERAFVFRRSNITARFVQHQAFIGNLSSRVRFGYEVSLIVLNGTNTLAVIESTGVGRVHLYEENSATFVWTRRHIFEAQSPDYGGCTAVALYRNYLIVGAANRIPERVFIYKYSMGSWNTTPHQILTHSSGLRFGLDLGINCNILGIRLQSSRSPLSAVAVYTLDSNGLFIENQNVTVPNPSYTFGAEISVAGCSDMAVAERSQSGSTASYWGVGRVYLFRAPTSQQTTTTQRPATTTTAQGTRTTQETTTTAQGTTTTVQSTTTTAQGQGSTTTQKSSTTTTTRTATTTTQQPGTTTTTQGTMSTAQGTTTTAQDQGTTTTAQGQGTTTTTQKSVTTTTTRVTTPAQGTTTTGVPGKTTTAQQTTLTNQGATTEQGTSTLQGTTKTSTTPTKTSQTKTNVPIAQAGVKSSGIGWIWKMGFIALLVGLGN